jgi:hypothetical protein
MRQVGIEFAQVENGRRHGRQVVDRFRLIEEAGNRRRDDRADKPQGLELGERAAASRTSARAGGAPA